MVPNTDRTRRPSVERGPAGETVAASLMCADFGHLGRDLAALRRGGVRRLHLDFGDGRFVPNFPLGVEVFSALRGRSRWTTEAHLMIEEPARVLNLFLPHVDLVIFHIEATSAPGATISAIRTADRQVGLALNPATRTESVRPWLDDIDQLVVMSVEPGFAGGQFVPGVIDKIRELRKLIDGRKLPVCVEVDGAVSAERARVMAAAGASRVVGGTSGLFREGGLEKNAYDLIGAMIEGSRSYAGIPEPHGHAAAARRS